ncbi:hypothetical protein QTP88_006246 [Uroleucon formosanum]
MFTFELVEKIRPNEVDAVISAEISNVQVDSGLHEVVIKNMIHGPCGTLNQNSHQCSKRYPRTLISETITGDDGYPLYRRLSTADNGRSTIVKLNQQDIEIDNRWIVPYSPILSKTFKAHINVESCHSVKSIKYICKYVTKGSDMAVIGIGAENSNDKVTQYQMGHYVSSNEAVWRIFSFPIHERHHSVVHLAVHLKNGQRVYFTAQNVESSVLETISTLHNMRFVTSTPVQKIVRVTESTSPVLPNQSTSSINNYEITVSISPTGEQNSFAVYGRRIININNFFEEIKKANDHSPFDCKFNDMELIDERMRSLDSVFHFKCSMCRKSSHISTEGNSLDSGLMEINTAVVAAIMSNGYGFTHSQQFLSTLEIPSISGNTYKKVVKFLIFLFWQIEAGAKDHIELNIIYYQEHIPIRLTGELLIPNDMLAGILEAVSPFLELRSPSSF